MDKFKSYINKGFQKGLVNDVYKSYQIRLNLTDADIHYLTLNDKTATKTSYILSVINKHYHQVLDYRNIDAENIVKNIIRMQALCPANNKLYDILYNMRFTWSHSDCHRLITNIGNIYDDETVSNIMYIIDEDGRFEDTMCMIESCTSTDLQKRSAFLYNIRRAARKSSWIYSYIPDYLYKAGIMYLSACNDIAGFIPKSGFELNISHIMYTPNYNIDVIKRRTMLLQALYESDVLDQDNASKLFPRLYKLKKASRHETHIVTSNIAYCMIIYLNSYKILTPSVLYSILDAITICHDGKAVLSAEDIIGNMIPSNIFKPILKELKTSELYYSCDDWAKFVSIDS